MLDWEAVQATLHTHRGRPFRVIEATETRVLVSPVMGWQYTVSRANLEKAVKLLSQGEVLARPRDYRAEVAQEQPPYAWGICRVGATHLSSALHLREIQCVAPEMRRSAYAAPKTRLSRRPYLPHL